ncbi:abscisic stress-ripening protein 5-like [Salvia miltiorrhiza]|uniref:abscisic stress-ripening protein 5-like n=1 Tax=Salvia miltiorrhiza TaxID=226208 RepID=UPI0025ABF8C5|nr:abscisic stress-ripening protein 5-like [Salvia miltiorrhiza]
MAEEKHRHHHHRHMEEEEPVEAATYSETAYTIDGPEQYTKTESYAVVDQNNGYEKFEKEEKQHKRKEHLAEIEAMAATGIALYEKREAKKDPQNEHRHKIEEEIAAAAAVGGGGYAFYEKKEAKEEEERAEGKKHRHFF